MSIYTPSPITEQMIESFVPCRLYIKELAGVKYFGKTSRDPYTYLGSGIIWKDRIKKYGKEQIKTLWVSDLYHDPKIIQEVALSFSKENGIVESTEWANMKPENGLNGGRHGHTGNLGAGRKSAETKRKKGIPAGGTSESICKGNVTKRMNGISITQQMISPNAIEKAKETCNDLANRPIVEHLRLLAKQTKTKLGSGWVRKPNHWILIKLAELNQQAYL
jgi:hypothetical protein